MASIEGRLAGKVAIVTGAGSSGPGIGNGKATAILFAREGARVLLADLHEDRARETLAAIEGEGGEASTVGVDVTVEEHARQLAATAVERYGRIDVLVNNVGISKRGSVLDVTAEEWDRVMAVNVKSMMLCSQHVIPQDEGVGWGFDNQHCVDGGVEGAPQHALLDFQGGGNRADVFDGGGPRSGWNPGECDSAGAGVHADGCAADGGGDAGASGGGGATGDGGDGVGCRVGGGVLASDEARWVTGVTLPVDAGLSVTTGITDQPLLQQRWG